LASLLYDDREDQDERTLNQIFAPGLEELELEDITFAADPRERDTTDMLGTDLQSLQHAISTREQARLTMTRYVVGPGSEEEEVHLGCPCCATFYSDSHSDS
ncbi:hypothetical protein OG21DRAFT_1514911, partial [Imleria badia]